MRINDVDQIGSYVEKVLTHRMGSCASEKQDTLRPRACPAPRVTISTPRPVVGCRGTDGIKNTIYLRFGFPL